MKEQFQYKDWSNTSLGSIEKWPQALYSAVNICLSSNVPACICWGDDFQCISNDTWSALTGNNHPPALGEPAREMFEGKWPTFKSNFQEVFSTGEVREANSQLFSLPDGEKQNFTFLFNPIWDKNGEVCGIFIIAQAEKKLTESEGNADFFENVHFKQQKRLYEAIISSTPDLVYVFDLNYRFIFANDALLEMWGLSREEYWGKTLREVGYEEWHAAMHEREIDQVIATKQPVQGEVSFPHAKLGKRYYDYIFVPVLDGNGKVEAVAGTTRDITKRKEAQKELEEINESLEQRVEKRTKKLRSYQKQLRSLASKLNKAEERERYRLASELHDKLGQMLVIAKMKIDGLQHGQLFDQPSSDIEELKKLVNDALKFNQNLMVELKPPPVLNKDDVTEILRWTAKNVEKQGLDITFDDDGQPKPVEKEILSVLNQSVRELLHNILKHAGTNKARIDLSRVKEQVKITVEDSGKGFTLSDDRPTPTKDERYGLFNIQERMNWHGGSFKIHTAPGEGTKAILYAPLKEEESLTMTEDENKKAFQPLHPRDRQRELWQEVKVLLVDDHDMVRRGLRQMIDKQDDMTVVGEASDGQEAVELTPETFPDIVVMDVNMPGMDGIEATQKIKAEMTNIRVIGLSLHDSPEVIQDMKNAGASAYLTKDEAFETLCKTIREVALES